MNPLNLAVRGAPKVLALVAFGFLCVVFGIASARFEFFPYPLVRDAWHGAQAARHLLFDAGGEEWAGAAQKRRFERSGVRRYDPTRTLDGYTLYTSWHAPEIALVDMTGEVVRRWHVPFSEVLAQSESKRASVPDEEVIVRQARLLPDGDLVAVYERPDQSPYGWGLARFDSEGRLRWSVIEHLHHDFALGPDGRIYALGHEIRTEPRDGLESVEPPCFDEFLVTLSPDGEVLDRLSIFEAFAGSRYREALLELADLNNPKGDYLHPNALEVVDERIAAQVPGWRAGQVLVSLLEMNGLALIDPVGREVVWFIHGAWHQQHDPDLLPNGNIVLFDNQGDIAAGMHSQILEIDPVTGSIVWRFASTDAESFYSKALGSQQILDNGNILVTESLRGRIFEITRSGDVVWEYLNPVERDGFHAYVLEAQRVPPEALPFLGNDRAGRRGGRKPSAMQGVRPASHPGRDG
jgi:Arylsulfotransferase (ASST)